jgi:hypothetical protein
LGTFASGEAEFGGTAVAATTDTGDSLSYDWDYGDSTTHGTALAEVHTYAPPGGVEPAGGWTAVLTVTATGDAVHESGTATATCTKVVDFIETGTGSGVGGTGSPGAPTSCSWADVLCDLEAAAAWLFVPGSSFFTTWDGFTGAITTKAPFGYATDMVSFVTDGEGLFKTTFEELSGGCTNVNVGVGSSCVDTAAAGSTTLVTMGYIIEAVMILGFAFVVIAEVRRQLKAK